MCLSQPELKTFQLSGDFLAESCRAAVVLSDSGRLTANISLRVTVTWPAVARERIRMYSLSCHADHLWVPSHVSVQRFPTFWQVEPQKVHQAEGKPWLRNSTWTIRWHLLFLRTLQRSEANKTAKSRVHRLQWFAISVWFTYSNHFKPPWLVSGISQSPCEAWQDPGFGQVKSPNVAFCPNGTLRTTRTPRASRNGMVVQYSSR